MKIYQTLLIILLFSLAISCKKNTPKPEPQLPAITQEGLNTFGCLIDGEVWVDDGGLTPYFDLACHLNGFSIIAEYNKNGKDQNMSINIYNEFDCNDSINTFILNNLNLTNYCDFNVEDCFFTDSLNIGEISIIKFDVNERIVSGTFWFDGLSESDNQKIIKVQDGRFDIKF